MDESWKQAWQPVVDAIGQSFGPLVVGADIFKWRTFAR